MTDPQNVAAVCKWKVPSTLKELRSFLGFCTCCRHLIQGFSKIAGPLHDLVNQGLREGNLANLKKVFDDRWNEDCQASFEELQEKLISAPVLGFADFGRSFIIETDASNRGLGAVLYQKQGDKKRVLAYESRRLRHAEKNGKNHSSVKLYGLNQRSFEGTSSALSLQ